MVDKLTDAQVAALADAEVNDTMYDGPTLYTTDRELDEHVTPGAAIRALALEVQSTRAKRCETCRHWRNEGVKAGECQHLWFGTNASWSCASHTPK